MEEEGYDESEYECGLKKFMDRFRRDGIDDSLESWIKTCVKERDYKNLKNLMS